MGNIDCPLFFGGGSGLMQLSVVIVRLTNRISLIWEGDMGHLEDTTKSILSFIYFVIVTIFIQKKLKLLFFVEQMLVSIPITIFIFLIWSNTFFSVFLDV